MNHKKVILIWIMVIGALLFSGCGGGASSDGSTDSVQRSVFYDGNLRWISINVYHGDAHLITKNDISILIDGGTYENGVSKVIPFLKESKIDTLDEVMITHAHGDHYGGIKALLEDNTIKIKKLSMYMPTDEQLNEKTYEDLINIQSLAMSRNIIISSIEQGNKFEFDSQSYLEVLYIYDGVNTPVGRTGINGMSAITMIYDNNNKFLLTGDLDNKVGTYLAANATNLSADVLKVPHHAIEEVPPNSFFDKVGASDFIITAPEKYWQDGYASSEQVRTYVAYNDINAYINGIHGNIIILSTTDGYTISVDNSN